MIKRGWCMRCFRDKNKEDLYPWKLLADINGREIKQTLKVCKRCRQDLQKARDEFDEELK